MARSIRGWIRNLADGLGPPPGSVSVQATVPDADGNQDPLNAVDHALGNYTPVHVALSGDPAYADALGHWGWDMEFSPGPITQTIVPDDPQTEYRKRFPDESAPIGKAYHSDLERLAWTGGRDALVWNAIPGGHDPAANAWSWDPLLSGLQGNLSIASFGNNMSFTLRRGIAFVGGTVFSIEMADLTYPYAGVSAAPVNATVQDRWDLVCLHVVTDPAAYNYGKQQIEVITGTPGAGIPPHPGQPTAPVGRRLAIHALKVPANASAYVQALDLRRWLWHPAPPRPAILSTFNLAIPEQVIVPDGTTVPSVLNTVLQNVPMSLPLGYAWRGVATYSANIESDTLAPGNPIEYADFNVFVPLYRSLVSGAQALFDGYNSIASMGVIHLKRSTNQHHGQGYSVTFPMPNVGSYHVDSNVAPASRVWPTARAQVHFVSNRLGVVNLRLKDQRLAVEYYPVA